MDEPWDLDPDDEEAFAQEEAQHAEADASRAAAEFEAAEASSKKRPAAAASTKTSDETPVVRAPRGRIARGEERRRTNHSGASAARDRWTARPRPHRCARVGATARHGTAGAPRRRRGDCAERP